MSRIRANTITNQNANGAPNFPDGITVSGVVTSTTINANVTGDLTVTGNVGVGGTITYEDVTNIDSVGVVTARTDINLGDSIIHIGDTNTKIRFPAADTVTVETAGSERIRVGAGGSIGINETTPDSKVDILHSTATNGATENLIHLRTDPGAGYLTRGLFVKIGKDGVYDNSAVHYDIVGSAGNSGFHAFEVQGVGILTVTAAGANVTGTITANSFVAGGTALGTFNEGSVISLTSGSNNLGVSLDTILSTTKRIEIFILGMSLTGNSEFKFQLRTAAGTVSSGYVGRAGYVSNASYANDQAYSDSWSTYGMGQSGVTWSGHMTIKNYKDNYWYMNADLWSDSSPTHYWIHGHVNAGALVSGFRFDKRGGNFDAGEFRLNQYSTP